MGAGYASPETARRVAFALLVTFFPAVVLAAISVLPGAGSNDWISRGSLGSSGWGHCPYDPEELQAARARMDTLDADIETIKALRARFPQIDADGDAQEQIDEYLREKRRLQDRYGHCVD